MRKSVLIFIAASLISVLAQPAFSADADNQQLKLAEEADQSDRKKPEAEIDWIVLNARDEARRKQVLAWLQQGKIVTANDFYNAAMIYQHGDNVADYRIANALATVSMTLNPENKHAKWLYAASWDRLLMNSGKPQWFGTQYRFNPKTERFELYAVDLDAVSDQQREEFNVPDLKKAKEMEKRFNQD